MPEGSKEARRLQRLLAAGLNVAQALLKFGILVKMVVRELVPSCAYPEAAFCSSASFDRARRSSEGSRSKLGVAERKATWEWRAFSIAETQIDLGWVLVWEALLNDHRHCCFQALNIEAQRTGLKS